MMEFLRENQVFCEWVLRFRDGTLTDEELQRLKGVLRTHPEARRYYIELVMLQAIFHGRKSPLSEIPQDFASEKLLDWRLWQALAKEENTAEPIPVQQNAPQNEENYTIRPSIKQRQTLSKVPLYALIASAAALVAIILLARFSPFRESQSVALLADTFGAVWADSASWTKGTLLSASSKPFVLRAGLVQILFDNFAQVTVEAPASFQLLGEDMLKLHYGKLYAVVPSSAYGFQICTRESKIIDLGTEFGIAQGLNGDTEVHVLRGKVVFVSKASGQNISLNLPAGEARRLRSSTGQIKEIECREDFFVRYIDSSSNLIWKGQSLSLADLIGGGNGFGGGDNRRGINLSTGQLQNIANQGYETPEATGFRTVKGAPFVDGVFVPNGASGPTIISSLGHQFLFPPTSGEYWSDITSNPYLAKKDPTTGIIDYVSTRLEVEEDAETGIPPRLLIHPNAGITFDLDQIRRAYPTLEMKSFRVLCGLPQVLDFRKRSEFWVLVDGNCVFHYQSDYQNLQSKTVEIPITPTNRFLTLAATDGGDGTHYDWCIFAQPILIMERK
ncbi:MAG TPA: NPCBM/NEW2 domain-containing protein [Anaerohalosphaeraceae bacterium]|nr:NPCBM/NEW2 domain-containing protein [Anaerohalosphaeraceae bacterium]